MGKGGGQKPGGKRESTVKKVVVMKGDTGSSTPWGRWKWASAGKAPNGGYKGRGIREERAYNYQRPKDTEVFGRGPKNSPPLRGGEPSYTKGKKKGKGQSNSWSKRDGTGSEWKQKGCRKKGGGNKDLGHDILVSSRRVKDHHRGRHGTVTNTGDSAPGGPRKGGASTQNKKKGRKRE